MQNYSIFTVKNYPPQLKYVKMNDISQSYFTIMKNEAK